MVANRLPTSSPPATIASLGGYAERGVTSIVEKLDNLMRRAAFAVSAQI
jgi:hypothetical protein